MKMATDNYGSMSGAEDTGGTMEPVTAALIMAGGKMLGDFLGSEAAARQSEKESQRAMAEARRKREQEKLLAARSEKQDAMTRMMSAMGQTGDRQASALDRIANTFRMV